MSEQRFTAPITGWYRYWPDTEEAPEYLGAIEPFADDATSTVWLNRGDEIMGDGDEPPQLVAMNSGGTLTLDGDEPSLVIPWDHE